ncbi:MAG: protein-glutamate methylesterase/protein-glutamine glutaminase [Thermoplasmatota archaeon]
MTREIRVLVVDDSLVMRRLLTDLLEKEAGITVIGTAKNGMEAVSKAAELQPSVITMDIEMPMMDGLTALQHIMAENPMPVVMLSAMNKRQSDIVIKALEMGAIDFIPKTSGTISLDIEKAGESIVSKIRGAAEIEVKCIKPKAPEKIVESDFKIPPIRDRVVAIGASTGGPKALLEVISSLPRDLPAAVLIVQHMPEGFTQSLAERLNWQSSLEVKEAQDGDRVRSGLVYIAPGNRHMEVDGKHIRLTDGARVNHVRPSADVLMESVAVHYGPNALGVLMTGMGQDGAAGIRAIKRKGGRTIAQDESSCAVFGMPKAAIELRSVDEVEPIEKIAQKIISMLRET